ncbi:YqzL family protein [Paenibacillus senegalensis]|nr:YqzL family protein [Paenibacillus senegalensis]
MKEFFWDYFTRTGNIDAYMLYKDNEQWKHEGERSPDEQSELDWEQEA